MATRILPDIADPDAPGAMRLEDEAFADALTVVSARHALDLRGAARVGDGSSPVFLTDRYAVKFVPPPWVPELDREIVALARVHGRLPVRTPSVVATDTLDAWRYLVSDRLPGIAFRDARPTLTAADEVSIARAVGESLAALHRVPCDDLASLTVDWRAFAAERAAACVAFQRKHGLDEAAAAAIPALLDDAGPLVPDARRVLLHADLHHEHVLLERRGERWVYTGMIDFGDAVVAHPDYELVTPMFFVVAERREAQRAFFDAMGFRCDAQASKRLMAWSAMHRFNALARYVGGPHDASTLEALRGRFWPVIDS
jgi:hygromycin-B 7''-O-kinase